MEPDSFDDKTKNLDELIANARTVAQQKAATETTTKEAVRTQNTQQTRPAQTAQDSTPKIRTFEHDAKVALSEKDASLARIHIAEQKKQNLSGTEHSSGLFWTVLIILLACAGAGVVYIILHNQTPTIETVTTEYLPQSLLSYDTFVDIPAEQFILPDTSVGIVYLRLVTDTNETALFQTLRSDIYADIPNILVRNTTDYMLGIRSGNPFLVLKVPYVYSLTAMREWEKTRIPNTSIWDISTENTFQDYFIEKGTLRGNGSVYYAVLKNGTTVISQSFDDMRALLGSL